MESKTNHTEAGQNTLKGKAGIPVFVVQKGTFHMKECSQKKNTYISLITQ